jgi:hypothetical protein
MVYRIVALNGPKAGATNRIPHRYTLRPLRSAQYCAMRNPVGTLGKGAVSTAPWKLATLSENRSRLAAIPIYRPMSDRIPDPWRLPLTRSVKLKHGPVLKILADVRKLILALPPDIQKGETWQALCEDLLAAADTEYTDGVTETLEVVLEVWNQEFA